MPLQLSILIYLTCLFISDLLAVLSTISNLISIINYSDELAHTISLNYLVFGRFKDSTKSKTKGRLPTFFQASIISTSSSSISLPVSSSKRYVASIASTTSCWIPLRSERKSFSSRVDAFRTCSRWVTVYSKREKGGTRSVNFLKLQCKVFLYPDESTWDSVFWAHLHDDLTTLNDCTGLSRLLRSLNQFAQTTCYLRSMKQEILREIYQFRYFQTVMSTAREKRK